MSTPDSTSTSRTYLVFLRGAQLGPYTLSELRDMLRRGELEESTQVWTAGMPAWQPLKDILRHNEDAAETLTGLGALDNFSFKTLCRDIFRRHTEEEAQSIFCAGTPGNTPELRDIPATWPAPWLFTRVLLLVLLVTAGLYYGIAEFGNLNLVPGCIFIGNFGVPFCVLVLFYELNIRRDVPFYSVTKAFFLGGVLSLLISLLLFRQANTEAAFWAGFIEEPGKLLAVLLIAGRFRNGNIGTGLLLGCAVGAGFAAFESAGYTFCSLARLIIGHNSMQVLNDVGLAQQAQELATQLEGEDPDAVMMMRAALTPFAHAVWTAITAGAYWYVISDKIKIGLRNAEDRSIDFSILRDTRFLRIALIPVALHALWNSTLLAEFLWIRNISLGIIGWVIALRLMQVSINQVKARKKAL